MSWSSQARIWREQNIKEDSLCDLCGSKESLKIEHIIPRSILLKMGYTPSETWELKENLCLTCKKCNDEKRDYILLKWHRTHKALLEILDKNKPTPMNNEDLTFRAGEDNSRDTYQDYGEVITREAGEDDIEE
jgi:hypothetical protein